MIRSKRRATARAAAPVSWEDVRAYLRCRRDGAVPDSRLGRAWDHFYKVYSSLVKGLARRYVRQACDADDVAQRAWTAFVVCPPECLGGCCEAELRAWFRHVVFTKAMDLFRDRTSPPTQSIEGMLATECEPPSKEDDPGAALDREWRSALVWAALEEVCPGWSDREIGLFLVWLQGQPVKAIADAESLTPGAVRACLGRVWLKLRTAVAARCPELADDG